MSESGVSAFTQRWVDYFFSTIRANTRFSTNLSLFWISIAISGPASDHGICCAMEQNTPSTSKQTRDAEPMLI